jgi:type VI protein secretion system component VasF
MASDYTPVNVTSGFGMETTINQNFNEIKTAMDKLLNREVSTDNAMEQTLDMGGFALINLPQASEPTHPVRLQEVNSLAIPEVVKTLTFSTTMSVDASSVTYAKVTLADNATINFTGTPTDGQPLLFAVRQDAVGGYTVTWDASRARFSDDLSSGFSSAANKLDYLLFRYNADDDKFDLLALNRGF